MPRLIGTRNETSLHRDLKFTYAGEEGRTEAEVDGFVADGISANGEFIEVQTANFAALRKKITKFTEQGKLRIIYPVIITKYIEVFDADGERLYRRKSPRRGSPWDIFNEFIYAPDLPLIPRCTIELALVDACEQRVRDGKGSWWRKGLSIRDRQLITVHERICLKKPSDYRRFIPFEYDQEFTTANLAEKAGISHVLARRTLYVLTKLDMVQRTGKQRNAFVYQLIMPEKTSKKPLNSSMKKNQPRKTRREERENDKNNENVGEIG
ncbi:MAG: hypothetical protein LBB89_10380 [Treponema sp.]|jgi:predicted transcriptional regulator|nr:hypothetical protein [Treponema sp.]